MDSTRGNLSPQPRFASAYTAANVHTSELGGAGGTGGGGGGGGGDGGGDGGDSSSQRKRQRQPRNSACQPCANLKMKCVPSSVQGVCERCNRMKRDCVASVPKPRKRREGQSGVKDPPSPLQASQLNVGAQRQSDVPVQSSLEPPVHAANRDDVALDSLLSRQDISYQGSKSFHLLLVQTLGLGHESLDCKDLIKGIDFNTVSNSLTVFRQLLANFPFLDIPLSSSPVQMIATRPFLVLAICIVTAAAAPDTQLRLTQAFTTALSDRVHVQGQCSYDLLLGLMVFISWQHQYAPGHQTYQELCLLSAMCVDLRSAADLGLHEPANVVLGLERDRAFLGCYYLCCGISTLVLHRSTPLEWTDDLDSCAKNISQTSSTQSDQHLLSLIELMCAVENAQQITRHLSRSMSGDGRHVDACMRAIKHRFTALKRQCPPLMTTPGYAAASILLQCQLLRLSRPTDTAALIQCAVAIRDYMDDILHRSPTFLYQIAIVDWANLLQVLAAMTDMSCPDPQSAGWEVGALASMMQPEKMLDSLCNHMTSAPSSDALTPRHDGLLQRLREQCGVLRRVLTSGHDRSRPSRVNATTIARAANVLDERYWRSIDEHR